MTACPRCGAPVAPDQDWCVECGAAARTRLAGAPNWRLPTIAVAAIVALAGAALAFAFVQLTEDAGVTPAGSAPVAGEQQPAPIPPAPAPTSTLATPTATSTAPVTATPPPTTVPGQTAPPAPPATTPAP